MYNFREKKSHTGRNIFLSLILILALLGGGLYYFKPEFFQKILRGEVKTSEINLKKETKAGVEVKNSLYMDEYKGEIFATVLDREGVNVQLKVDIYRPTNLSAKTPVVIYIPGKNWNLGKDDLENNKIFQKIKELKNKGITVVVPEYRDALQAPFPAQIHDVKGAVRYLKANSEKYGLLKNSFVAVGEDTGGSLALMLGSTEERKEFAGEIGDYRDENTEVKATAVFGAVTDIMNLSPDMSSKILSREEAIKKFDSNESMEATLVDFGNSPDQGMKLIRKLRKERTVKSPYWEKVVLTEMASPLYYINEKTAPALIVHGVGNTDVPLRQSLKFVENLMKNGVENIYLSNSKGTAGYQSDEIGDFTNLWLIKKLDF
ncbi:MAG: alpha/beta hydrolase fold domain-containing protein [Fusobacteriaceae bacterium]